MSIRSILLGLFLAFYSLRYINLRINLNLSLILIDFAFCKNLPLSKTSVIIQAFRTYLNCYRFDTYSYFLLQILIAYQLHNTIFIKVTLSEVQMANRYTSAL